MRGFNIAQRLHFSDGVHFSDSDRIGFKSPPIWPGRARGRLRRRIGSDFTPIRIFFRLGGGSNGDLEVTKFRFRDIELRFPQPVFFDFGGYGLISAIKN